MSDDIQRRLEEIRRAVVEKINRQMEDELVYGTIESRIADELIRESGAIPPKPKGIFG